MYLSFPFSREALKALFKIRRELTLELDTTCFCFASWEEGGGRTEALEASGWPSWRPAVGVEGATLSSYATFEVVLSLPFPSGNDKNLGQRW